MKLVATAEVQRLTGLSAHQLREWTIRRRIVEPDQLPHGPGSRARFSWQTVLRLRLASILRESFHMELSSLKVQLDELGTQLSHASFPSLWGRALLITSSGRVLLENMNQMDARAVDCVVINLEPHLQALTVGFDMDEPILQRSLFPALAVR